MDNSTGVCVGARYSHETAEEAGFTLVEVLTAIVVLVFGLIAVTNLLLVGSSNNIAANQGTAATAMATTVMEQLKVTSWPNLVPGGGIADPGEVPQAGPGDVGTANSCPANAVVCDTCPSSGVVVPAGAYSCERTEPGVGRIHVRWLIEAVPGQNQLRFITVRAWGTGLLARSRSKAQFSTFRACSDVTLGCPAPP